MKAVSTALKTLGLDGADGRRLRLEPDSALVELVCAHERRRPAETGRLAIGSHALRLNPRLPPGRASRKARAYTSEILRLHEFGYTLEAIRQSLANIGVTVSVSTVWRETTRHTKSSPAAAPHVAALPEEPPAHCRDGSNEPYAAYPRKDTP